MVTVRLRFYAELNEHLAPDLRQIEFPSSLREGTTLGAALACLGIPANEVSLFLVNGESVGLSHCLKEGDRVSVYPVFDAMDVGPVTRLPDLPLRRMRFVLDVHLGKLAHHLRMMGFDALYRNSFTPTELIDIAARDDRILLSMGASLIEKGGANAGYRIRSSNPREQLVEILRRFDLWTSVHPFERCLHCNEILHRQEQDAVLDRLPEKVRALYHQFNVCPACSRVYWEGTHFARMKAFVGEVLAKEGESYHSESGNPDSFP